MAGLRIPIQFFGKKALVPFFESLVPVFFICIIHLKRGNFLKRTSDIFISIPVKNTYTNAYIFDFYYIYNRIIWT